MSSSASSASSSGSPPSAASSGDRQTVTLQSPESVKAAGLRPASQRISAVLADIDGTLVRPDKSLSDATIKAIKALEKAGIPFSLASARPPRGLQPFITALDLTAPLAAYNGGTIVKPDLTVLESLPIPADVAQRAIDLLKSRGIGAWVFTRGTWEILDPNGDYVDLEERTIGYAPTVVKSFDDLSSVDKILAASKDEAGLIAAEKAFAETFGDTLSAHRSQAYYLDITHPAANKGHAAKAVAAHLNIPLSELAVLGDMGNDLPMFKEAGLAIAMGQSGEDIQSQAHAVTLSNADDGVAAAIYELIMPRIAKKA